MVLLLELELDYITDLRGDIGGTVEKFTRASNNHLVYLRTG
jgi:hypothetical protein